MITVGVREFRDYFVENLMEYSFICIGMSENLTLKFDTEVYAFQIEDSVIDQLGAWVGRNFENWWNGIDCTMSEEDMYRWYCIGHQYLMDVGVEVGERSGQYFVNPIGERRAAVEFGHIRIARIGLLTDILDKCGDVEFVFNL